MLRERRKSDASQLAEQERARRIQEQQQQQQRDLDERLQHQSDADRAMEHERTRRLSSSDCGRMTHVSTSKALHKCTIISSTSSTSMRS